MYIALSSTLINAIALSQHHKGDRTSLKPDAITSLSCANALHPLNNKWDRTIPKT
ncbi:hypothetical protein [Nostoc sp. TCL26-01]|uniref:hypothetical protein n=1 Tax=Nostoc sp. TCL26-01 TaxID=2576904 RepID=UPI0015C05EFA|nr:hypothetical protein [Nostoc sp. TCL26-01]